MKKRKAGDSSLYQYLCVRNLLPCWEILGKIFVQEKKEKDDMQKFSVQSSGSAALFHSRKQWHHN